MLVAGAGGVNLTGFQLPRSSGLKGSLLEGVSWERQVMLRQMVRAVNT